MAGAGHCSGNRDPVRFNLLVREFTDEILGWRPRRRTWTRAQSRPRRVLMVPGSRTALDRDIALADALTARRPGLVVEWLVGEPLRTDLLGRGAAVHASSTEMPDVEEAGEDAFGAWYDSDEAQFLSFMVLLDVSAQEPIDLVIADGATGIDHHLHDNPELKQWAYAWLTDEIGWTPAPGDDDRRREQMADANAATVARVTRFPRIRDRAVLFGSPDDLPDSPLGPELPSTREWAKARFAFAGKDGARSLDTVTDRLAELL